MRAGRTHEPAPRILVTGAGGFLGRNLVAHILASGAAVPIAALREPGAVEFGPGAETVALDLADGRSIEEAVTRARPTHVINCGAYGVNPGDRNAARAYEVNVAGAVRLLTVAAVGGARRFVQIGTCAEYGPAEGAVPETAPLDPRGPYARSKAAASLVLCDIAEELSIDLAVARLFGMWGPHEPPHRLIPSILRHVQAGARVPMSPGDQIRDFSFAPDVAAALLALTLHGAPLKSAIVNLGSGRGISVKDFAVAVAGVLDAKRLLDFGAIPMRRDEVASQIADVSRLRELGLPVPPADIATQFRAYLSTL